MTQANGLSPRAPKQHQFNMDTTTTISSSSNHNSSRAPSSSTVRFGHFFEEPLNISVAAGMAGRSMWKGHNRPISPKLPLASGSFAKLRAATASNNTPLKRSTVRLLAAVAIAVSAVPWLYSRGPCGSSSSSSLPAPSALRGAAQVGERCASHASWGVANRADRRQCVPVLPASVVEGRGWLVVVHVDRAPSSPAVVAGQRLRGRASAHRDLPHQYFVRAMEATLHSIASTDPGARVDVAVMSEGRWGGMVDEIGVPVDWDVEDDICLDLGLDCTQTLVLLEDRASVPDALECIAAADVFVSSESNFSQAAAVLSNRVKVLTDKWEMDEDDMMVALNPATTIGGMPAQERQRLQNVVNEYRDCSEAVEADERSMTS